MSTTDILRVDRQGSSRLSPAAAISLKRGGEERPSRRKEGWEVGTEGTGAGAGPPGKGKTTPMGFVQEIIN